MEPGPLLRDPWPLFSEPCPRLSICIAGSSVALLICPTAGEVRSDNPAMVPNMISFQLVRFIVHLLLKIHGRSLTSLLAST
jgi:hypothetical protein